VPLNSPLNLTPQAVEFSRLKSTDEKTARLAQQKAAWLAKKKKQVDYYRKIFVGGIAFDDIEAKKTDKKEAWNDEKIAEIKDKRRAAIVKLFKKFGKVQEVQEYWDKRYFFVTFWERNDAQVAFKTLKDFKNRKALCTQIKEKLREKKRMS